MQVRWGLVLVLVLVGIVALWRGIGWYFDPLTEAGRAAAVTPPPTPAPAATPAPARLPEPTPEEIALLASPDPGNQVTGADTLATRAITPDVMRAVDAALAQHPEPNLEARLVCLKTRFPGPETLEFLLARFPSDRKALAWNLKADVGCMLKALAARIEEAPDRVMTALMPAIYSGNGGTRETVLRAFRTLDVPEIPPMLVAEASTSGTPNQREALSAALALGAVRLNPALVAGALREPDTASLVTYELRTSTHPNAARIVANAWVVRAESEIRYMALDREAKQHDVSAALLEIVRDPSSPELNRIAAANHLETLGEIGALHDLRALLPTIDSLRLKAAVDAAIKRLETLVKGGQPEQMRLLPPQVASASRERPRPAGRALLAA